MQETFAMRSIRLKVLAIAGIVLCIFAAAAVYGSNHRSWGQVLDLSPPGPVSTKVSDLVISVSVKPDCIGENLVGIWVMDTRRPAPAPIDKVLVRFSPPGSNGVDVTAAAVALGNGRFQVSGKTFDVPGVWKITISVKRPGLKDAILAIPWSVLSP